MIDQIQLKDAREQGMQQGMQQGVQQGTCKTLLRQMRRSIGEVPHGIAAKLQGLTIPELDEFGDALFDLKTYAEVEAWLTKH